MENLAQINLAFYIVTYLLTSIPFGFVLAKIFANIDIREYGSGNIGATNVLRVLKEHEPKLAKKLSIVTLILDVLKGALILLIAKYIVGVPEATLWAIAVLAVLGHTYSIFLMFEGGKGVATGLGVSAVMLPIETGIAVIVWFIVGKIFKISSLSSLLGLIALFTSSFYISPEITHVPIGIITFLIVYKHIPNIARLITGKESKVV
jgi:glycerol-3-phosphate acyltransferase PlsY